MSRMQACFLAVALLSSLTGATSELPTNNSAASVWKCDNESTHVQTCGQHITVYLEHLSGNNCTGAVQNTGEMTIGCNSCAAAPQ